MPETTNRLSAGFLLACLGAFVFGFGVRIVLVTLDAVADDLDQDPNAEPAIAGNAGDPRGLDPYRGYGVWIDAFDFDPAYQNGAEPELGPDVLDDFADAGVDTIYLQASRRDERAQGPLLDDALLERFLVGAHDRGMAVVAWYLPRFDNVAADLSRALALATYRVDGHQFDGVAIDIEFTGDVPDVGERNRRLIEFSRDLDDAVGDEMAIGAIVLPTVQIEVISDTFWPSFPWVQLAPHYDVWLPMAYSTTRTVDSGYRDAARYAVESTERMRQHLDDPTAPVHLIGGIGDAMVPEDFDDLVTAVETTDAMGVSIYDWNSLSPDLRAVMHDAFADAGD